MLFQKKLTYSRPSSGSDCYYIAPAATSAGSTRWFNWISPLKESLPVSSGLIISSTNHTFGWWSLSSGSSGKCEWAYSSTSCTCAFEQELKQCWASRLARLFIRCCWTQPLGSEEEIYPCLKFDLACWIRSAVAASHLQGHLLAEHQRSRQSKALLLSSSWTWWSCYSLCLICWTPTTCLGFSSSIDHRRSYILALSYLHRLDAGPPYW